MAGTRKPTRTRASRKQSLVEEVARLGREHRADTARRPPLPDVLAAAVRAERMIEQLGAFVLVANQGSRSPAAEKRLQHRAAEVERMWNAMTKATPERDAPMRFVGAVEHASALSLPVDQAADVAREIFMARRPEYDEVDLVRDAREAVAAWRARDKWPRILSIVERVFGPQTFADGEALRVEYKRWRKRLRA